MRQLAFIDPDRAKAIVQLANNAAGGPSMHKKAVEVVEIAPGKAVILIGPTKALRLIPWLRLAEVAPERFLLVVPPGTPVESLEVAIMDLLEGLSSANLKERPMLEELRQVINHHRRHAGVSKAELLFINI